MVRERGLQFEERYRSPKDKRGMVIQVRGLTPQKAIAYCGLVMIVEWGITKIRGNP